ncbi:MAG: DegT/DnrJ/EryC1/StrS family aminotransferase [Steroidobacteraceae bacterium]
MYANGTSALSAAISAAISDSREAGIPEVIAPAYACPDIATAAISAGARLRLVDFDRDNPQMPAADVLAAVTRNTVAVVCVNFLGSGDNAEEIRAELRSKSPAVIILDACQAHPDAILARRSLQTPVIFSFGRGKPVNALIGGLLLQPQATSDTHVGFAAAARQPRPPLSWRIKQYANNLILILGLYDWLRRSQLFGIGETHVRLNQIISVAPDWAEPVIRFNWLASRALPKPAPSIYSALFAPESAYLRGYHSMARQDTNESLLRLPVLCRSHRLREHIMNDRLCRQLGISTMYPQLLADYPQLQDHVIANSGFPNADNYAERLITLPLHSRISKETARIICDRLHLIASRMPES